MVYLLFTVVAALTTAIVIYFGAVKGVVDIGKFNIFKLCDEITKPFKGTSLTLLAIICFASSLAIQISLYINTSTVNFIKLFGLYAIVFSAGVIDAKRKIIPNSLIIIGLIFRAAIYLYEILFKWSDIKTIAVNDLIGFTIGFVFLALVSFISKGALGFGDAKLFGVIGLTSGSFCTYSTLLLSLIISAIVSVINIARKKLRRNDTFPFGPCITAGYAIALLLTSY